MVENKADLAKVFEELESLSARLDFEGEVNLAFTKEGLVMRLSEKALFDSGVAAVSPEAYPLLGKIGAIIAKTAYFIRIEGHTDNLPIHTRVFPSNWELSTARAVNVLRYFIETHKIDPQRLAAVGFAEYQPLTSNNMQPNQSKNRRVEIIFIKQDPQQTSIEGAS
jgi:chemotaxis protein MotB